MLEQSEPLTNGELRVQYAFTDKLTPAALERCVARLSPDERARYHRFHFEADRQSYALAHALARRMLVAATGIANEALRFEQGPHGRPELCWSEASPRPRFNLSHTRGLVACALMLEHDSGVDVEHIERRVEIDRLAPTVFSPAELIALQRFEADRKRRRFFELWTLKEAYIKAVGQGLGLPLRSITFDLDSHPTPRVSFADPLTDRGERWFLHVEQPAPGFMLSAAAALPRLTRLLVSEVDER